MQQDVNEAPISYQNVRDPVNRKLTFCYVLWQKQAAGLRDDLTGEARRTDDG